VCHRQALEASALCACPEAWRGYAGSNAICQPSESAIAFSCRFWRPAPQADSGGRLDLQRAPAQDWPDCVIDRRDTTMTAKTPPHSAGQAPDLPAKTKDVDRTDRLAAALRENLKRRKAQTRLRSGAAQNGQDPPKG
jgi:hypothetical protein